MLNGKHYAGEIVESGSIAHSIDEPVVKASDGTTIPTGYVHGRYNIMFVMPAQDITIQ